MNASKEKAPCTAVTMQGRNDNVQEKHNIISQERQEGFRMAGALESLATEIEQTRQLVGLLVDSLEDEGKDSIRPARVKVYSDSLWVLFDHLGTLGDVANSEAAHYYQKGRDAQ